MSFSSDCSYDLIFQVFKLSLVQGYQQRRGYIATQGPLEHTTGDLWRMVVENGCSCIVMLCTLMEEEQVKLCACVVCL